MRGLILAVIGVVACGKSAAPAAPPAEAPVPSATTETEADAAPPPGRAGAKEGAMCGGFAGIPCEPGLSCEMTGPMHPDKSGICKRP